MLAWVDCACGPCWQHDPSSAGFEHALHIINYWFRFWGDHKLLFIYVAILCQSVFHAKLMFSQSVLLERGTTKITLAPRISFTVCTV